MRATLKHFKRSWSEKMGRDAPEAISVIGGCKTVSGPDSNSFCVFPFRFEGVTYTSCTQAGNTGGNTQAWCSTLVNDSGEHVGGQGKWGNCESKCQTGKLCHKMKRSLTKIFIIE